MGKAKASKNGNTTIPHKHIHSRLSYLHQAATYLATSNTRSSTDRVNTDGISGDEDFQILNNDTPSVEVNRLLGQIRGVSQKSQLRLSATVKHTICKRCDSLLIAGRTSGEAILNPSKNGKKPWADLFEIRCLNCGTVKRFAVGSDVKEVSKFKTEAKLEQAELQAKSAS